MTMDAATSVPDFEYVVTKVFITALRIAWFSVSPKSPIGSIVITYVDGT